MILKIVSFVDKGISHCSFKILIPLFWLKGVPPDFAYSSQYLPNLAYRLNRPRRIYWYQQFFSKVRGSKDTRGQAVFQCNQVKRLFDIDREVHLHIFDMPCSDMTCTSFIFCKLSLYFIFSLCFRVRNNVKKRPFKLNDFSPAALFDNHGWSSLLRLGYYCAGSTAHEKANSQFQPYFPLKIIILIP